MNYFDAIYDNDAHAIRRLLSHGHDLNATDLKGNTPLIAAILFGRDLIANILVEAGADVNVANNNGWTALHSCAKSRLAETAKLLLDRGAQIDARDMHGNSSLFVAVMNAKLGTAVVELLIRLGADVNLENNEKISPKGLAESISNFDVANLFGAGPGSVNKF